MSDDKKPTQDEIDAAKTYVIVRLGLQRNIDSIVNQIVGRLVEDAVQYSYRNRKLTPIKVLKRRDKAFYSYLVTLVHQHLDEIRNYIEMYVYEDCSEDDENLLEPIVFGEVAELTFDERMNVYATRLVHELEIAIAANMYMRVTEADAIENVKSNLYQPYENDIVKSAEERGLPVIIPSFGRGVARSQLVAIATLADYTLARGMMKRYYLVDNKNAVGWYVMRGSAYPCALCDSKVGYHEDMLNLPPYHPHCCCIAIPIMK
jgi:hypothetical protein